jgi:hypothetical protein
MSTVAENPVLNGPAGGGPTSAARKLAEKGDKWYFLGAAILGTWLLGPIGLPIMLVGMYMLRKAEKQGVVMRPWAVLILGGLMLVDASGNVLLWGIDTFWSHDTVAGRTLWIDYGLAFDGGYATNYNTTPLGGVAIGSEKAIEATFVFVIMPIKIMASWGFMKMKRWGLQWAIISNWMYFMGWIAYVVQQASDFPLRFGISEFGVTGMWIFALIPFMGPLVLLPYLHTVNKELWT